MQIILSKVRDWLDRPATVPGAATDPKKKIWGEAACQAKDCIQGLPAKFMLYPLSSSANELSSYFSPQSFALDPKID